MRYDPDQGEDGDAAPDRDRSLPAEDTAGAVAAYFDAVEDRGSHRACMETAEQVVAEYGLDPDGFLEQYDVLVDEDRDPWTTAGYLLTAGYNAADQERFSYDRDLGPELRGLGYRLDAETTLILEEPVQEAGRCMEGTIVNRAGDPDRDRRAWHRTEPGPLELPETAGREAGIEYLGRHATGTVVNEGAAEHIAPEAHAGSLAINTGSAGIIADSSAGDSINYGQAGTMAMTTSGIAVNAGRTELLGETPLGVVIDHGQSTEQRVGPDAAHVTAELPAVIDQLGEIEEHVAAGSCAEIDRDGLQAALWGERA